MNWICLDCGARRYSDTEVPDECCGQPLVSEDDFDPTPWCNYCGARCAENCKCGPIAAND